jgi:hypothetical protein
MFISQKAYAPRRGASFLPCCRKKWMRGKGQSAVNASTGAEVFGFFAACTTQLTGLCQLQRRSPVPHMTKGEIHV